MKITINGQMPIQPEIKYPRLLSGRISGSVFLQLSKSEAVCLTVGSQTDSFWKTGKYCDYFDASDSIPFTGSITLSND